MGAGLRIDELGRNAEAVIAAADRAFEHIAHAELAPEFADIDRLPLVLKGGVAGENAQIARPR